MKNNNIKAYEYLYLREGNKKNSLDYMKLLELYKSYLSLFIDYEENNPFYNNVEFLSWVVNGFSYYHNKIFGVEDIDVIDSYIFSLEQYDQVLTRATIPEECSVSDLVFMASWSCNYLMLENDLIVSESDIVQKLIDNLYRIDKVMNKKNNREDPYEMEYWKHRN